MSASEHNCKGTVANQVLPVELKLPNGLHPEVLNFKISQQCLNSFDWTTLHTGKSHLTGENRCFGNIYIVFDDMTFMWAQKVITPFVI